MCGDNDDTTNNIIIMIIILMIWLEWIFDGSVNVDSIVKVDAIIIVAMFILLLILIEWIKCQCRWCY